MPYINWYTLFKNNTAACKQIKKNVHNNNVWVWNRKYIWCIKVNTKANKDATKPYTAILTPWNDVKNTKRWSAKMCAFKNNIKCILWKEWEIFYTVYVPLNSMLCVYIPVFTR